MNAAFGSSKRLWIGLVLAAVVAFFLGFAVRGCGTDTAPKVAQETHEHAATEQAGQKDENIVWTCSMHPQIRLPAPGKCPICFMDLIPVKKSGGGEGTAVSLRQIELSPEARALAQVETAKVVRREVEVATRLLGKVAYDETRLASITARIGGRLDKLYVDYTGQSVKAGQPLADIYSPELLTAQAELIQAAQAANKSANVPYPRVREAAQRTLESAREKLRLWGLTDRQIKVIEERGQVAEHITIYAPFGGVVIKKDAVEGTYVKTGMPIYTIADLSRVWVVLEAYESDLPWIHLGQNVSFTAEAMPGKEFSGEVVYIDPTVNETTRTIAVRLNAPNQNGQLKPGMFVRAKGQSEAGRRSELVIPASAPLLTGKRAIVYLAVPGAPGTYEGREVVLGARAGDAYVVLAGLSEGEEVVTRGNFKIDSAVQLQAKPSMMTPEAGMPAPVHAHGQTTAAGSGTGEADMNMAMGPATLTSPEGGELAPIVDDIRAATAAGDLPASRQAYTLFYEALCAIDPSSLTGENALLWKELTMVLKDDAVLGQGSDSPAESKRLWTEFEGHWQRFTKAFDVVAPAPPPTAAAPVAPAAFRAQLAEVYDAGVSVQSALAADDLATAKASAVTLARSLDAVDPGALPATLKDAWKTSATDIRAGAKTLAAAGDLSAARDGFLTLSRGLVAAAANLGLPQGLSLNETFCPMADQGKGATWLQSGKDIKNPFYGASMLTCGEVRRTFTGPGETSGETSGETAGQPAGVPPEVRGQLELVTEAYLAAQKSLADDDLAGAKAAAPVLAEALEGVDMGKLSGETHMAWMKALGTMHQGLTGLAKAGDLAQARAAFIPLSEGMIAAIKTLGLPPGNPAYVLFCPMAAEGKGAVWVQSDKTVRNPFYGPDMLTCGEVREELAR